MEQGFVSFSEFDRLRFSPGPSDEKHRHDENEGRTDHKDVDGSRQSHVFLLSQPLNFMSKMCRLERTFDAAMRQPLAVLIHDSAIEA